MIRSSPSIPIPRTVPVLPLHDKVLLPGVVTRLQISRRESIPLFEKILRTYDSKELSKCIIAVFPVRGVPSSSASSPSSSPALTSTSSSSSSEDGGSGVSKAVIKRRQGATNNRSQDTGDDEDSMVIGSSAGQVVPMRPGSGNTSSFALTPAHLHGIGCAARLVRLERAVGGFTVVLEGKSPLSFIFCFSSTYNRRDA